MSEYQGETVISFSLFLLSLSFFFVAFTASPFAIGLPFPNLICQPIHFLSPHSFSLSISYPPLCMLWCPQSRHTRHADCEQKHWTVSSDPPMMDETHTAHWQRIKSIAHARKAHINIASTVRTELFVVEAQDMQKLVGDSASCFWNTVEAIGKLDCLTVKLLISNTTLASESRISQEKIDQMISNILIIIVVLPGKLCSTRSVLLRWDLPIPSQLTLTLELLKSKCVIPVQQQ